MRGAILAVALVASSALADPPVIPSPVTVPVNRDYVVKIKVDDASKVGYREAFNQADCLFFRGYSPDPKEMVFLVRPYRAGEFQAVFWTQGETASSVLIINPGTAPTPPGPNPPGPTPPGPLPDGALGLIKASRDGLAKVTTDKGQAAALAKAQRSHASAVAASAFPSAAAILAGWREANRVAANTVSWAPWGEVVSAKLSDLYRAGKLPDSASWSAAFNEIASGLDGGN